MKTISTLRLFAIAALMLPFAVQAQSLGELQDLSPEERRAYWESMSEDERAAKREQLRAEREAMTPEQREQMREQIQNIE